MLRLMIAPVLVILILFSSCSRRQVPEPQSLKTEPPPTNHVIVLFSGLMVFHPKDNTYELGIVGPDVSNGHIFSVGAKSGDELPTGLHWTLQITNSQPTAITELNVGHSVRRPDNIDGQFDLSWMIDLESSEFHGRSLSMTPKLLKPIILLPPNGRLYTQYKSIDLERWQGPDSRKATDFGFVPETIGLHVELNAGQELVLRDDAPGPKAEVFRVRYRPEQPPVMINVNNVRHPYSAYSDFRLYYKLFQVPEAEQFDFKANEDNKLPPFNPHPGYANPVYDKDRKRTTCCMMACTAVLTRRSIPLD